tara:strand:+ start:244 stop:648 length:405 start_codon:yes stop_codon:yes gene_type:complete
MLFPELISFCSNKKFGFKFRIPLNCLFIAKIYFSMQIVIMLLKRIVFVFSFIVLCGPASSTCFVDYKAKKNNPLRLHYGVVEVDSSQCTIKKAEKVVSKRIEVGGWLLLGVMSLFDESGLEKRKSSAGKYFLLF